MNLHPIAKPNTPTIPTNQAYSPQVGPNPSIRAFIRFPFAVPPGGHLLTTPI
jgi:hypothetical protein